METIRRKLISPTTFCDKERQRYLTLAQAWKKLCNIPEENWDSELNLFNPRKKVGLRNMLQVCKINTSEYHLWQRSLAQRPGKDKGLVTGSSNFCSATDAQLATKFMMDTVKCLLEECHLETSWVDTFICGCLRWESERSRFYPPKQITTDEKVRRKKILF